MLLPCSVTFVRVVIMQGMHDLRVRMARPWGRSAPRLGMSSRLAAFIRADRGIARLGVNLESLPLQDQINRGDFILGLDRVVGDMVNSNDELGHDGPSWDERGCGC